MCVFVCVFVCVCVCARACVCSFFLSFCLCVHALDISTYYVSVANEMCMFSRVHKSL